MKRIAVVIAVVLAGCGGGSSSSPLGQGEGAITSTSPSPQPSPKGEGDIIDPRAKYWEPMVRSKDYTGQIAVMFKENAGVRFGAGVNTFRSKFNTNLKPLNDLMARHLDAAVRLGLPNIDQDFLDQRVAEIRDVEGYPMTDWGSFYIIDVVDADEAMEVLNGLVTLSGAKGLKADSSPSAQNDMGIVWFTHPIPRAYPTGIQIPSFNPGPGQDYLKDLNSTGGLNVKAAWDAGLDGTGVVFRDVEGNWNVDHLDLPLSSSNIVTKVDQATDPTTYAEYQKPEAIQHGTAVAGIVVGKNNGIGITGEAPKASFQMVQQGGWGGALTELINKQSTYADGPGMKPGDVMIIELQWGFSDCASSSTNPSNGCFPDEAIYDASLGYKDLINYGGIVVVEAAANGGVNFDAKGPINSCINGSTIPECFVDLSKDSSGAIMVGASMGGSTLLQGQHTLEKAPYSNCGSRVDVFAWGMGVVTTGYGTHPISVKSDPNQWYANDFGGTSSATAIIAGAAALLQQYARQLYTNPQNICAIQSWEYAYLSSQQMRDVMVKSGTAPKAYNADSKMWGGYQDPNPGCNIGVQPDLAKAMQIIKDGCDGKPGGVKATVLTKDTKTYCPKATLTDPTPKKQPWCQDDGAIQPPIGKMMDLDGDGRADIISFSRDRKWYVDLSSIGPTQFPGLDPSQPKDNFGTWNLVFDLSKDTGIAKDAMLFPVVMDYNTDGKADLALYDSVHGKWYVSFTTGNTLNANWPGWDMVIDYSTQPHWKPYSRPVPGDYNGQDTDPYTPDHYMDLALQTPDGLWLIDFGGQSPKANYGSFDQSINYLTNDQVNEAPGWAWLPSVYLASYDNVNQSTSNISIKAPDDISDVKMVNKYFNWDDNTKTLLGFQKTTYGSNADIFTEGKFQTKSFSDLGFKKQYPSFGLWQVATVQSGYDDLLNLNPFVDFGDINCRVIPGDYDGDGYDDRAVQCGKEWRIAYTGSKYPMNSNNTTTITLDGKQQIVYEVFRVVTQTSLTDPLPGFVYPGGVSYKDTKDIFAVVNYLCPTVSPNGNKPPCSLLTMTPAPISPYFPQCVDAVKKQYAIDPCGDPNKKVACETMHIQQAQCVYQ